MQGARSRLVPVGERVESEETETLDPPQRVSPPERKSWIPDAATALLITALKTLSQKTIVALASLVDFALIMSAFALWIMVIANPTILQLVGVGGYALFVLCAIWARGRHAR